MDITVAYFHPLLHPETVRRDFDRIRAAGAGSIVYAIYEQEEQRQHHDLERGLQLAQDVGLKVYLSLGRYGNLFAGPSPMPSWYTFRHPHSRVMDSHGRYHDASCFNHQPFRAWLFKEIEHYLASYPINGIFFDEPRGTDITCFCSACRALCPDVTDLARFRRRSMVDFLGELCTCIKRVDRRAKTTIVLTPNDLYQLDDLAELPDLDTLGCHPFWHLFNEDVAVVEDESGEKQLEPAFVHLINVEPDEIACYYYWRNNVNPMTIWQAALSLLRRVPRRQLYWHIPPSGQQGEKEAS